MVVSNKEEWAQRVRWMLCMVTYGLFLVSPLSITGIEAASILIYLFVLAWTLLNSPWQAPWEGLPTWLWICLLAFPSFAFISALANPDPLQNVVQLRLEHSYLLLFALMPALAIVNIRRALFLLLIIVSLLGIYAVPQHLWGVDWVRFPSRGLSFTGYQFYAKGTFTLSLTFSGVMLLNFLLFGGLVRYTQGRGRWVWMIGTLLASLGLLAALGRSGWIGAAVGLLMLLLGFPRRVLLPIGGATLLLTVVILLFIGGWVQNIIPIEDQPSILKRLANTTAKSEEERLYLWESALLGIADRPILGVGYGNDAKTMAPYREQVSVKRDYEFILRPSTHSHNVYLQVAFELGLLGLVGYLALWGGILVWCANWVRRTKDRTTLDYALLCAIPCALVGSMVAGFFENNFFDAEVQNLIFILMALALFIGLKMQRETATT